MLRRRTVCGPSTGLFQMPVWTVRPSHRTSFGRPTLTDSNRPTTAVVVIRPRPLGPRAASFPRLGIGHTRAGLRPISGRGCASRWSADPPPVGQGASTGEARSLVLGQREREPTLKVVALRVAPELVVLETADDDPGRNTNISGKTPYVIG